MRVNTDAVRLEPTLNPRCWPTVSGDAGNGATAARPGPAGADPNQRRCSDCRRKSWNRWARVRAGVYGAPAAASAGRTVSPCSEKLVVTPGTPVADCGTTI